jgi:NAD(P)-dependent dehydrogenase (short-subunit alcohol dehydrogenase family)
MELNGKTAVITGGASGIGLATAKQFAKSNVNLVLADIEEPVLQKVVAELKADGINVIGHVCDVSKEEEVFGLRDAALKEFGAAHLIFNNAGVAGGALLGTPKKVWDWVMGVNVDGIINGINAFVPLFLEQNDGHVVNTASLAGLGGVPGMGAYCASKFAAVGMSEVLYHELARTGKNVHVSCLAPGFVKTRIHESTRNMPKELVSAEENPANRDLSQIATALVLGGIDVEIVANAVEHAVTNNEFWILTHQRDAVRTTEIRAQWMAGGEAPSFGSFLEV